MGSDKLPDAILPALRHAPQRAVTSLNVEDDMKLVVDHMHTFWRLETGDDINQPDAVRILVLAALDNPRLRVPDELRERARAALLDLAEA
jgi:hypothetical protein